MIRERGKGRRLSRWPGGGQFLIEVEGGGSEEEMGGGGGEGGERMSAGLNVFFCSGPKSPPSQKLMLLIVM